MKMILAITQNNIIGYKGGMPWPHSRVDMMRFSRLTQGGTVVMGRKTWESLPKKFRPLPNRKNIVITRDENYRAPGADVHYDFYPEEHEGSWIIGGASIYEMAMPFVTEMHISYMCCPREIKGDTIFNPCYKGFKVVEVEPCEDHVYMRLEK